MHAFRTLTKPAGGDQGPRVADGVAGNSTTQAVFAAVRTRSQDLTTRSGRRRRSAASQQTAAFAPPDPPRVRSRRLRPQVPVQVAEDDVGMEPEADDAPDAEIQEESEDEPEQRLPAVEVERPVRQRRAQEGRRRRRVADPEDAEPRVRGPFVFGFTLAEAKQAINRGGQFRAEAMPFDPLFGVLDRFTH